MVVRCIVIDDGVGWVWCRYKFDGLEFWRCVGFGFKFEKVIVWFKKWIGNGIILMVFFIFLYFFSLLG